MKTKQDILIAGGTGFIGNNLCKSLSKKKFNIFSCSSTLPAINQRVRGVKYIKCDLSKKKLLYKKIKKNFDYVINLAGYIDHSNAKKVKSTHFEGCKNLANLFIGTKIKKFIQFGSSVEYGFLKSPQNESNAFMKNILKSHYGKAKYNSTKYLMHLNKDYNFPTLIFRLYLAYGPGQNTNRLIPYIIKQSLNNKKFPCSDGKQVRDFIYISDIIKLIKLSLSKKNLLGVYNLGSGKPLSVRIVIKKIIAIIGFGKPLFGTINLSRDEPLRLYPNIKKTKRDFKWMPKIDIDQGLKNTVKFFNK